MNIMKRKTLVDFWKKHTDSKNDLEAWFSEVKKSAWHGPAHIKKRYQSADFLKDNRVVFNIHGNRYRLIVKISYKEKIVFIRFVGTHAEYSKINAETI
ncbi:MAG TPA: type II toxin-antitoxin system HigB family toxin [Smithellaceae bacterium]|nr:type II toxin-antitoxin system HigB family toxin [Smithellaceae bacterium]